MIRRPLRLSFGATDEERLIEALRMARELVIRCQQAQPFQSERRHRCEAVSVSIDALAEDLTGDRKFFM
jgi:hypothetical protein